VRDVLRTTPRGKPGHDRRHRRLPQGQGRRCSSTPSISSTATRTTRPTPCTLGRPCAGADGVVLCDTNGGSLPHEVAAITRACARPSRRAGRHPHPQRRRAGGGQHAGGRARRRRAGAGHDQRLRRALRQRQPVRDHARPAAQDGLPLRPPRACAELREVSLFVDDLVNLRPIRGALRRAERLQPQGGPHVNAVQKNPADVRAHRPERSATSGASWCRSCPAASNVLLKARAGRATARSRRRRCARSWTSSRAGGKGYAFEAADASFRILIQKVLKKHKPFFELDGFRVIVEKRGKDEPCISEATVKVRSAARWSTRWPRATGRSTRWTGPAQGADRFYPAIAKWPDRFPRAHPGSGEATAAKTRVLIESGDGERPGARWASRRTSSRPPGRPWWTAWSTSCSGGGRRKRRRRPRRRRDGKTERRCRKNRLT
jgi:2-isopropylmalate synthase